MSVKKRLKQLENMVAKRGHSASRAEIAAAARQTVEAHQADEAAKQNIPKVWPSMMLIEEAVRGRMSLRYGWYLVRSRAPRHVMAKAVIARLGRMAGLSFPEIAEPFGVGHSSFVTAYKRDVPEADALAAELWKQLTN